MLSFLSGGRRGTMPREEDFLLAQVSGVCARRHTAEPRLCPSVTLLIPFPRSFPNDNPGPRHPCSRQAACPAGAWTLSAHPCHWKQIVCPAPCGGRPLLTSNSRPAPARPNRPTSLLASGPNHIPFPGSILSWVNFLNHMHPRSTWQAQSAHAGRVGGGLGRCPG